MVDAVAILGSAPFLATALDVALDPTLGGGALSIASVLVWPTVSEFWMAGYLVTKGVRRAAV